MRRDDADQSAAQLVCNTGGLRATSSDGVLSSESTSSHGRSFRGRPAHSISLPRTHSGRRRTKRNLGNIGDGTITRINARR